jgi:hypothetical protein
MEYIFAAGEGIFFFYLALGAYRVYRLAAAPVCIVLGDG